MFKELKQTCEACPSQWEGQLKTGEFIYIRYRWGNLGIGVGDTIDKAVENYEYGISVGDSFDGQLSTSKMIKLLPRVIAEYKENKQ